ncbi:MAG: hypothetical protein FWD85_03535 [Microbacteriaceae bacterium]|nr:hypothetical protein [Microbacteriaceae bacterium]MCL2794362.1 hypothetical protein [Microbacteriaceae bacterium]
MSDVTPSPRDAAGSRRPRAAVLVGTILLALLNAAVIAFYALWNIADTWAVDRSEATGAFDPTMLLPHDMLFWLIAQATLVLLAAVDAAWVFLAIGLIRRTRPTTSSTEIRFFPDWGHRWPLWGFTANAGPALTPNDLGLSPELAADLRVWWDFWDAHLIPDPPKPAKPGWDDERNCRAWVEAGMSLQQRLAAELGSAYRVRASFASYE